MRVFILTALFLVPLAAFGAGLVPCAGPKCQACDLVTLGQNILNWLILVSAFLIAIVIAVAGLKMVTAAGNVGAISSARESITHAIVGLIILLAAWLIVDTVMKALLPGEGLRGFGPWNEIQCLADLPSVSTATPGGAAPGGAAPSGGISPTTVSVRDANGNLQEITLNTSRTDADLASTYGTVSNTYASQIQTACQSSGTSIPNCNQVVAALVTAESNGNTSLSSSAGAVGVMQLLPSNGGQNCGQTDSACIQSQISKGVTQLNGLYSNNAVNGNTSNALAAYNAGNSTAEGGSASGLRPALAPSQDCQGLLAYHCPTNPGGLAETQSYVANICRTLTLKGSSC